MGNPTVIGGNAASSAQGMDLTNPNIMNMIKAMQLAQYQGQQGEAMEQQGDNSPTGTQFVPAANPYAPARAIKQSALVPLAGAAEKMTGTYMQKQAMQNQITLAMAMQQARDNQKFGTGVTGMAAGSPAPAGNPAPLAAAMTGPANGSGAPPVPPVAAGTQLPPPPGQMQAGGFNPQLQAMGAIPPIAAATPGQPSNPARGSLTASEAGIPTPPQEANVSANGSIGGMPFSGATNTQLANAENSPNLGNLGGNTPEAPPQVANLSTGNPPPKQSASAPPAAPLSTGNSNVPAGMTPDQARALSYTNPEQYQKLLDAQVATQAKNAELTNEEKNSNAGIVGQNKLQETIGDQAAKYGDSLQTEATQALLQKRSLAQMQNYFSDFTPGKLAGMQQAIAQYKISMGDKSPETVRIAAASEGVDKQAASLALEQMKALNNAGGSSGNGNRVEFQSLLQNTPNTGLSPLGAKSIIDYMDKGTNIPIQKQQAYQDWLAGPNKDGSKNTPLQYQQFDADFNKKAAANIPNTINNIPAGAAAPPAAINFLKQNPAMRAQFEQKYGTGSAAGVLGQ